MRTLEVEDHVRLIVSESRSAQGLPEKVEDAAALATVADLLASS